MTDIDIDIDAKLQISPADLVGERVVILGASGSGKSNTAAALVEELIGEFPITIIDPDGDYFGIREKYAALWIGDMEEADLPVGDPEQAAAIAELSFCRGVSVILDFSESKPSVMIEFLTAYLDRLWALSSPRKARKPYGILVEEAAVFVPQGGKNTPLREVLVAIATRGRKRGITTMLVGQRATKIDKDLVTQARWFILHQVIFPNDLALYKEIVPLPDAEVERMVNGLAVGQAIFRHEKTLESVTIRKRHTFHSGATPGLEEVEHPPLQKVDTALLAELREMMGRSAPIPLKAVSTTNGKPSACDK
jgi:hypothetical protein